MRCFSGTARKLTTVIIALAVLIPARQSAHSSTDFFDLVSPPRLGLTLFARGYGNEQYGSMHEGFELQQSVTRLFSLVARISVCQSFTRESAGMTARSPRIQAPRCTTSDAFSQASTSLRLREALS